jgi:hypothetical protein
MANINTMTQKFGIALAVLFSIAFVAVATPVQAEGGYGYDYSVVDSMPSDSWGYDYSVVDSMPSDSWGYDYTVVDSPSSWGYDYTVLDSYPTYGSSYGGSSFGGFGGFSMPFSTMGGGGNHQSQSQSQGQSQSQSSTNTNVNNNVITINQPVAQTPVYPQPVCPSGTTGYWPNCVYPQPPQYDICPNIPGIQTTLPYGYYIQNGYCYQTITSPVYPITPYVTLSQVPYTGYELGPVGTALYWGFLVLWCLIAAYLIAVKKVQNKVAAWFTGSSPTPSHAHVAHSAPVAHAPRVSAPVALRYTGIDPFIQSQINRASK